MVPMARATDGARRAERRAALDQIGLEERGHLGAALGREPRGVRGIADHGHRDVRAADRLPLLPALAERVLVDREPELLHRGDHRLGAGAALPARLLQTIPKVGVARVDQVAEDVEVLPRRVDRRDLDAAHDPQSGRARGAQRLPDAVHRVVIGERGGSTPASAAASTTARGDSSPSEWCEWLWRSKTGGSAWKRRSVLRRSGSSAIRPAVVDGAVGCDSRHRVSLARRLRTAHRLTSRRNRRRYGPCA